MLFYITCFNEFFWHKYLSETNPMNAAIHNELRYLGFWFCLNVLAGLWNSCGFFFAFIIEHTII